MRKSSFQKTDENSRASRRTAEFGRKSRIPLTALPSKGRRSSSETRGDRTSNIPTFKRSKSQVHLTSAVTPIRAFTPSLPGSSQSQRFLSPYSDCLSSRKSTQSISKAGGRVVKDTRPLADKGFQQQEIQKITSFLCGQPDFLAIAPKGLSLRQLTLKLFVDIVNYLLGFLDENVTVNMTNYVVELPLILKKFGYVGNVNTSWLKTVNTMHSLPHVVGVFSWLVTLASSVVNTDSEAVLEDSLQNDIDLADEEAFPHGNAAIYLQHLLTQYRLWNAADEVGESNEEKRFISELCCRNGVSNEELRKISEDIQNLEVQFNNPKEIAEMETALEEERKYSEILKDHGKCVEYKAQMEEFLHYAETTLEEAKQTQVKEEENLRNLRNNTLQLKELLSHQTMTVEERDELLGKCNEITNMIRANEEFIAAVSNQCYADDIEMAKKRTSVDMKTKACNKIIVMESCVLPELMELHDDQNVLHEGAMERLAAIDRTASQMKFGLQKTLGDLLSKTKELQEELQQAEEKKASVEEEVKQLLQEVQTLEKAISDLKMKSTEETAEMRRSIEQLKISNQAKINCKTLQEAKIHLDKLLEKRKNGKAHIKDLKEKATDFFKKSVAITRNLMDSVSRAEAEFTRKVEERLNVTKDELKRCEGELYEHEV